MKSAVELMLELENDLINLLIKFIADGNMERADWQLKKLEAFGLFKDSASSVSKKRIPEILSAAKKEIASIAKQKAALVDKYTPDDKLADAVPIDSSPAIKAAISKYETSVKKYFVSAAGNMLNSVDTMYTQTVDKVLSMRSTHAITGREAISQIASEWADNGLSSFRDKAGRQWSTEAYAQMLVRTQSTQAAFDAQSARLDDLDCDLVEISSHVGARPKCEPYQGKIYSRNGKTKGYPLLSSTSIGEIDGLFGINCGHNMFPYFTGTKKTYNPYGKKENENAYKNSQQQRYLERTIRSAKKDVEYQNRINASESAKNAAKDKLTRAENNMSAFINNTGRTRREGREEIYN